MKDHLEGKIEFRTAYGKKLRGGVKPGKGPSRVKEGDQRLTDVNEIVKRARLTGVLPGAEMQKCYGSQIEPRDYQEALNTVIAAKEAFAALPSGLRARFGNDPKQLLTFLDKESNYDEAVRLGICEARVVAKSEVKEEVKVDGKK